MNKAFWFLTIVSILLNIAPILLELKNKNNFLMGCIRLYNGKSKKSTKLALGPVLD